MNRYACAVVAAVLLSACCGTGETETEACEPATSTVLDTPCAGEPDGIACCLGPSAGTCHQNECVVPQAQR